MKDAVFVIYTNKDMIIVILSLFISFSFVWLGGYIMGINKAKSIVKDVITVKHI